MSSSTSPRAPRRWALAAAALVAVLAGAQVTGEVRFAARRVGVLIEPVAAGGLAVLDVSDESPAAAGGLERGDRLISLEGQPLAVARDFDRIAAGFEPGEPVLFEVVRDDRPMQVRLTPGMPVDAFAMALDLVVLGLYCILGLLAATRAHGDRRATLLAAFSFAVAIELALPGSTSDTLVALLVTILFPLLTGVQFGLELHLASLIPAPAPWFARRPRRVLAFYGVGLALGLFDSLAIAADEAGVAAAAPVRAFADALLNDWLLPFWALAVVCILGERALRYPEPRGRHQAWLVLHGIAPWVAVILYQSLSSLAGEERQAPDLVWSLALLAYPVAIFAAIFLYQLFDLELVIRKTFVYGALTTLLVLVFYGIVGAGGALFARQFEGPEASLWVVSGAALALGLLFNPLRLRIERLIDRKIFPERQELRSRLIALAAELPAQGKLPRMAEHLARELGRIFGVDPVAVWISAPPHGQLLELASTSRRERDLERTALIAADDPAILRLAREGRPLPAAGLAEISPPLAERLVSSGAELAVPLLAQERMVGLLLVGTKRDRSRFVAEEIELLALVGHHAATVFENARLFDSATFEGLTGLYRREAVLEILDREWSRSVRYDRPLTVVVADLDRFKEVNDRFGHLGGDAVLKRVASELRLLVRETDFLGRFGGEEFLIVLPETTLEGGRTLAEKARKRVEELEIRLDGGESVKVTLSAGVASRADVRGESRIRSRALIAAADEALYAAKNAGRNRVELAAAAR